MWEDWVPTSAPAQPSSLHPPVLFHLRLRFGSGDEDGAARARREGLEEEGQGWQSGENRARLREKQRHCPSPCPGLPA